jgi:hypothetical protein
MDFRVSVRGFGNQKKLLRALGIPAKMVTGVGKIVVKLVRE